jgi:hypothetical protein
MKTPNAIVALAGILLAALLASIVATPAQARVPELTDSTVPGSQSETIYRPVCWTEDGYERWLRCAAMPDGAAAVQHHFNGGRHGPAGTHRY